MYIKRYESTKLDYTKIKIFVKLPDKAIDRMRENTHNTCVSKKNVYLGCVF